MLYHNLIPEYWPVYRFENETYCQECLPIDVSVHDDRVQPFSIEDIQEYCPFCSVCGFKHTYYGKI